MRQVRGDRISMIFQDPMTSLNPVLTIQRQLTESIVAHTGCTRREARGRGIELMKMVGIPSPERRMRDYPHQFSGGMRQRVMIAIAISCSPSLLIADEPTTALDVTIQAQIMELMKKICDETGTSVMLITHDLGIVAGACSMVAIMYAGRIVELAEGGDIFKNPRHPYTHGLLSSTPRMDRPAKKLKAIGGQPPSLVDPPDECPFVPRCPYAVEQCSQADPPLEPVTGSHEAACYRSREELW
jgi:oligopeptide transport system ATP-binding protein